MNASALSERLNPIVVKEVRQGLRTRTFWVFFGLMLLACVVIALIAFGVSQDSVFEAAGPAYFFAFFFALAVVSFFIIPYSAYRSLVREREEETWVLLTLTGLGSRRILRGKLGSALVQAALYGSAAAPFVLFSYFLNGVDLPSLLITLALAFAYMLFLISVAVSAATLGDSRVVRSVVHLALLGLLLVMTGMGLGMSGTVAFEPSRPLTSGDVQQVLGMVVWLMASYGILLFEGAAARLALPTEDYAKGPRLTAVVQWAVTVAAAVALWNHNGRPGNGVEILAVGLAVHLGVVGMFFAGERDGLAKRLREKGGFNLWRPGALRGFRLTLILLALSLGVTVALAALSDSWRHTEPMAAILVAPAYAVLYLSVPIVLVKGLLPHHFRTPAASRLTTVLLTFVGCGLPPLIGLLLGMDADNPTLNFFNPFVGLTVIARGSPHSPLDSSGGQLLLWACALVAAFAADRALAAADRNG